MADQANGLVLLRLQVQLTSHPGEMLWRCLVCSERLESGVSSREVGSSSLRLPVSRTLLPVTSVILGELGFDLRGIWQFVCRVRMR